MKTIIAIITLATCFVAAGDNDPVAFVAQAEANRCLLEVQVIAQKSAEMRAAETKKLNEAYAKAKAAKEERAKKEQAELESKVLAEQKAKEEKERVEKREARLREILGEGLYRSSKRKTLSGPVPILRPEPRPAKIRIWR